MRELVFGVIRGGAGVDTLVFIPAARARARVEIHFAIANASTWRQFAENIPSHDCDRGFSEDSGRRCGRFGFEV